MQCQQILCGDSCRRKGNGLTASGIVAVTMEPQLGFAGHPGERLLEVHQDLLGPDCVAGRDFDRLDLGCGFRLDLDFHLHGFENE